MDPSHQAYVVLVQGLTFVVLAQPISTRCTITRDLYAKLEGKPETSTLKGKVGQGDYKSIIFWSHPQSKVMMWDQQFVVFSSPWSTGKTICQREKARIWATDNPSKNLYFCVVREFNKSQKNEATEAEVEEWVSRWKRGEEKRVLVTDTEISRGWEAQGVIVIGKFETENLVMRTCGFCFLIEIE